MGFTLAFCVLLLKITAFAPPAYLFLGFILGMLLTNFGMLMLFRRLCPVYEAIIEWPRAFRLLKEADPSQRVSEGLQPMPPKSTDENQP
jgi:hypothetical protein